MSSTSRHLAPVPLDPFADVDFSQLERSLQRPRTLLDFLLNGLVGVMTLRLARAAVLGAS